MENFFLKLINLFDYIQLKTATIDYKFIVAYYKSPVQLAPRNSLVLVGSKPLCKAPPDGLADIREIPMLEVQVQFFN